MPSNLRRLHPNLKPLALAHALCLVLGMGFVKNSFAHALRCEVTYAGKTHHLEVPPTQDPYSVESVSIDDRFYFKGVHVQGPGSEPRIAIYVYREGQTQAVLIQQVLLKPPYPRSTTGPADLFGEQRLYAGKLERELIYRCSLDTKEASSP